MNQREVILHLSLIEGVGPASIQTIIAYKPKALAWQALYSATFSDWQSWGISQKVAALLIEGLRDRALLEKELAAIEQHSIQWTTLIDDDYPELLRHIHVPPPVLFWFGDISCAKAIAIVGSRDANTYGERQINTITPELVQHGYTIISGGALGADTMAHRAALAVGGKTIAVLGSGLLHFAPRTNMRLFENIIESGGAVLSIFPADTQPFSNNFPIRNRVIAGMSQGIVVAQAAKKSGARITAQFALEQGRDVFAIPGSIDDPLSAGCHALIQQGAKLIMGPQDILEEYGFFQSKPSEAQSAIPFDNIIKKGHTKSNEKGGKIGGNPLHQTILKACISMQSIDALAQECDIELAAMQKELFEMQMNGVIEQDFSGMWKVI